MECVDCSVVYLKATASHNSDTKLINVVALYFESVSVTSPKRSPTLSIHSSVPVIGARSLTASSVIVIRPS